MSQSKPSPRDFDIYRRSVVEFVSQSELAEVHGVSQQRVSQILREVARWIAAHPEDEEAQSLRGAASERLETVVGLAMRAFRESQQEQEVVKERVVVRPGKNDEEPAVATTVETTRRRQFGDVRYLHAAMRALEKQARLCPELQPLPRPVAAEPAPSGVDHVDGGAIAASLADAPAEAVPVAAIEEAHDTVAQPPFDSAGEASASSTAEIVVRLAPGEPIAVSTDSSDSTEPRVEETAADECRNEAPFDLALDAPASEAPPILESIAANSTQAAPESERISRSDAPHSGVSRRKRRRRARNRRY